MKHNSGEYADQLNGLAQMLVTPERFGDTALQDTVEFDPIPEPGGQVIEFPLGLRLRNPPELGWDGPEAA